MSERDTGKETRRWKSIHVICQTLMSDKRWNMQLQANEQVISNNTLLIVDSNEWNAREECKVLMINAIYYWTMRKCLICNPQITFGNCLLHAIASYSHPILFEHIIIHSIRSRDVLSSLLTTRGVLYYDEIRWWYSYYSACFPQSASGGWTR